MVRFERWRPWKAFVDCHPSCVRVGVWTRNFIRNGIANLMHAKQCCMNQKNGRNSADPFYNQATRTEIGRPRSSMRFSAWTGSVSFCASQYRSCSRTRCAAALRNFEDGQHGHGPAEEEHSAAEGGDVLVAAGTGAKVVAQLVVPSTEPGR